MRRVDLLITASRRATESMDFSDTSGIQDEEFLQYLDDAQQRIVSLIRQAHASAFLSESVVQLTQNQEALSLPRNTYLGLSVEKVEYSATGLAQNFYPLKQGDLFERFSGQGGYPAFYIRRGSTILLEPKALQGGSVRFTVQTKFPRLDKRRGTVKAVTLDTVNNLVTSLVLDNTVFLDSTNLVNEAYLTVVDKDGNVLMQGIPILAIGSDGTVTVDSFTFQSGETITPGAFVCLGAYSSTLSQLPDMCERYLLAYCNWKILKRDSSNDSQEADEERQTLEEEIVQTFAESDQDTHYIPIIDSQYVISDGW